VFRARAATWCTVLVSIAGSVTLAHDHVAAQQYRERSASSPHSVA